MTDYIKIVADNLSAGVSVVFYTVGGDTFCHLKELQHKFGLLPAAICDSDPKKQGRTYKGLYGIEVISPIDVKKKFDNAKYFVTSTDYRFEIIGELLERGVSASNIINYVPVKKALGCRHLYRIIYNYNGNLQFCWRKKSPILKNNGDNKIDSKAFRQLRDTTITQIQKGEPCVCSGCPNLCETYFPKEPCSFWLNYFCDSVCNFKCSYCTSGAIRHNDDDIGKMLFNDVAAELQKDNTLIDDYKLVFSTNGEPVLHKKNMERIHTFSGYGMFFNSNAAIISENLIKLMDVQKVQVVVSVDSGTAETFHKVKGVDCYDKLCNNLKRYASAKVGLVALKYIFVAGVNDDEANVDGFIDLCVETGATYAIIALDYCTLDKITVTTQNAAKRITNGLNDRNILVVPYTAFETQEYAERVKEVMG